MKGYLLPNEEGGWFLLQSLGSQRRPGRRGLSRTTAGQAGESAAGGQQAASDHSALLLLLVDSLRDAASQDAHSHLLWVRCSKNVCPLRGGSPAHLRAHPALRALRRITPHRPEDFSMERDGCPSSAGQQACVGAASCVAWSSVLRRWASPGPPCHAGRVFAALPAPTACALSASLAEVAHSLRLRNPIAVSRSPTVYPCPWGSLVLCRATSSSLSPHRK